MDESNDKNFQVSVKGLFFDKEGNLLMMKEESGVWEFPGGRVQKGEELTECLIRECQEETGLSCKVLESQPSIVYSAVDKEGRARLMVFYKIHFDSIDFRPSDECVEMKFFKPEEIGSLKMYPQTTRLPDYFSRP